MDFDLPTATAVLRRTPGTLHALLAGLPDAWTRATEGPETWSPYDVVGHLVHGERTDWIRRLELVLAQGGDRRFAPFDRTAMFEESAGKSMEDLLAEFDALRTANLARLAEAHVTPAQYDLVGVHPVFGDVTLRQLLATWVAHDLAHLGQIARVMAKQYREVVGPWREYLSIMDR